MKKVLITGAGGLIGSEGVSFFCEKGFEVVGVDNNMRQYFFGEKGNILWNVERLQKKHDTFMFMNADVRDDKAMDGVFSKGAFDLIIHAAGQPSHDWAVKEPRTDFSVNAQGTLTMLEKTREYCPNATFVFLSTNKVYGDRPNELPVKEHKMRYELPEEHSSYHGIDETMSIDNCVHSLFGVSKAAADLMVQEYGRYFNMKTACFRGGCLSGQMQSGVELHGFLSYLVKCIVHETPYTIYGFNGKQVRDNIHAYDVINAIYHFYKKPGVAAVYNIGGTRASNISMREAICKIEAITNKKAMVTYDAHNRIGDHIWYITNMKKFQSAYPDWSFRYTLDTMIEEMCHFELTKG